MTSTVSQNTVAHDPVLAGTVVLLGTDGGLERVALAEREPRHPDAAPIGSRIAYAAAHVVPKQWAENVPGAPADIDWDATLAFRHHLWSWGLGVADAMDTAQRNMGVAGSAIRELISRSAAEAAAVGGRLVVGVNTDELTAESASLDDIVEAYCSQLDFAEQHGAGVVLMASRHLAHAARGPDDYRSVYARVIARASSPVLLHWLGAAFDRSLSGYWGSDRFDEAAECALSVMRDGGEQVSGIKMSLLDAAKEISVRARLPRTARMYTGDDYNYVDLIEGDGDGFSHALLGAFSMLAPQASSALRALDAGDTAGYRSILAPTEALSRHVFSAPTEYYKTGVAFLSWLNGHQKAFTMVGGLHSSRSLTHLGETVRLADRAGALEDPELAARRWGMLLAQHGVDA